MGLICCSRAGGAIACSAMLASRASSRLQGARRTEDGTAQVGWRTCCWSSSHCKAPVLTIQLLYIRWQPCQQPSTTNSFPLCHASAAPEPYALLEICGRCLGRELLPAASAIWGTSLARRCSRRGRQQVCLVI